MKELTLSAAKRIKGKTITARYNGYAGQDDKIQFVVGGITNSFELAKGKPYPTEAFANFADYWKSYMPAAQIAKMKETLELLDASGKETYIRCHTYLGAKTFTCSDSDRIVSYDC